MPVNGVPVFGLWSVNVSTAVPPIAILGAPNNLLIVGGATTVSVSEAVPPVPPSVELTVPVVFACAPALMPVTFTENVHDDPAAGDAVSVPPDKLTVDGDPGGLLMVAVIVPLPHEPVTVVEASFTPPGKLSVNATPLSALAVFGLVTVKLNVLPPFSGMLLGLNDLPIVGGVSTVSVSEAVPPVPPSVELTVPVVFVCAPALMPVTFTENVHDDPAPGDAVSVPPDKLTVDGDPGGLLMVAVIVPLPHEPVTVVDASFTPPGKLSVNATPLSALVVFGLVTVKLNVLPPFSGTLLGLNDLPIVGGVSTVSVSEAVPPVPPSVELTVPVVFACAPALMPVTFTENVHDDPAPGDAVSVPPDKLTVDGDPGGLLMVAVIVPLPHEPVTVVEASFTPPGKLSVNATPLSALAVFGLVTVKLNVLLPFSGMLLGLNDLPMVGGATTVTTAVLLAVPVPPSVDVTALVVLLLAPGVVPVTLSETVHELFPASVPPLKLTDEDPAVAVAVPLQLFVRLLGVATINPAGKLSVNATPLSGTLVVGFVIVNVNEVEPFSGTVRPPNALLMVGGAATLRLAVLLVAPVPPLVELTAPVVFGTLPA
jgi:hypothetical protein